jgi:dTDP-4-amino-4,6-dideoxygalactose transaminase
VSESTGNNFIPFNRSDILGREIEHITAALKSGQVSGDKDYTRRCQQRLAEDLPGTTPLLTTSCTHALEMAALLLDIQPGDEVILPSFTFVSTANAFVLHGAKPVFADIRSDTLNLDETQLPDLITPRTKVIVPVHYAGIGCEMDRILEMARQHGVAVVEDNAHGLYGKYRGRWLGTIGTLATQSFHETKNFSCGEGGALIINEERFAQRAEIIREKGTNRARFFRGEVDKYSWVDVGSSYVMSDLLAAFLLAQLEQREAIQARRRLIWERYHRDLASWSQAHGIRQPTVPEHCEPAWHLYYLLLPNLAVRQALIDHLKARNILAVSHYLPLHLSSYAKRWGGKPGDCPVSESCADRLLRLPLFNSMTPDIQDRVVETLLSFSP